MLTQRELCLKIRGGLTQVQAAKVARVSLSTWRTWEDAIYRLPPDVPILFGVEARIVYENYREGERNRKVSKRKQKPIMPGQRQRCLDARGNLTLDQACLVSGYGRYAWFMWEYEKAPVPDGFLNAFRAAAAKKFPHYRSDLKG